MTGGPPVAESILNDGAFEPLKNYLIAATGLSYYQDRASELADHIVRHMTNLGVTDCSTYLQLLQSGMSGERELDQLIQHLTIGETFFFRHTELFKALEQEILPAAIEKNKQHRRLRVWSAGSSIGAEAYTISILLRRQLSRLIRDWEITIIGTDINRLFLARALEAEFEDWALRGVSEYLRQHCFTRRGTTWRLHPEFKQGVSFQYHNLAKHPFPSIPHNLFAFDVILFRNVMIYFSPTVIRRVIGQMRDCLVDGGWLFIGHAEHRTELFRDFRGVPFEGGTAYQRVDADKNAATSLSAHALLPRQQRTAQP